MTPRQVMAWSILADWSMGAEKAVDLRLNSIASRGNERTVDEVSDMLMSE